MFSKSKIINYIVPVFAIIWTILILIYLQPGGDITTQVVNTLISPILIGIIALVAVNTPDDYSWVRLIVGLVIITIGIFAWVTMKPLLAVSLILTIGAELLGVGMKSTIQKKLIGSD